MHRTAPPGHSVGVGATGRSESEGRAADASAFGPPRAQGQARAGGTRRGSRRRMPTSTARRTRSRAGRRPAAPGLPVVRRPVRERDRQVTRHACRMHVACMSHAVLCSAREPEWRAQRSTACDGWAHDGYGPQAAGRMPRKRSECDGREPTIRVRLARCGGLFMCDAGPAGAARACAARSA